MRKTLLTALTLSLAPAAFVSAQTMTGAPMSAVAYDPLYTESAWMTPRVPVGALGGTIPSDLALSASGLLDGTTISLTGVLQESSDQTQAVNAAALSKLTSGDAILTSSNVPVVGVAYDSSF